MLCYVCAIFWQNCSTLFPCAPDFLANLAACSVQRMPHICRVCASGRTREGNQVRLGFVSPSLFCHGVSLTPC
uniref:Putative secreted protein n=1 Tax=Anopheles marajoara TaxID=58244 RepID=A0A2M4CDK0_9DIPT